jgi:hypothetical protein
MRWLLLVVAVALGMSLAPAAAQAQAPASSPPVLHNVYGPYSVYGPGLTSRQPAIVTPSGYVRVGSVIVPDGGEALAASYTTQSEGRNEAGTPALGKIPYLNRAVNNVGYSRGGRKATVSVRARIIRMAEEEERQTGVVRP